MALSLIVFILIYVILGAVPLKFSKSKWKYASIVLLINLLAIVAFFLYTLGIRESLPVFIFLGIMAIINLIMEKKLDNKGRSIVMKFFYGTILTLSIFTIIHYNSRILFIVVIMMLYATYLSSTFKTEKNGKTLEDKIKQELKITFVERKERTFHKRFNWIGGFIIPAFPIMTVVNKNWKQNLTKEALIHEFVHSYYLIKKAFGIVLILGPAVLLMCLQYLLFGKVMEEWYYVYPPIIFFTAMVLVYFEKITFDKTNKIGRKFGIKTRKWQWSKGMIYLLLYIVQISIIIGIYKGLKYLVRLIL